MVKVLIGLALFLCLVAPSTVFASGNRGTTNFISNPGYENGLTDWTNNGWKLTADAVGGDSAITTTVADGQNPDNALICSKPYKRTAKKVSIQVTFKARGASTATDSGTGIGLFMVRRLNKNQQRIGDDAWMSTDGVPNNVWATRSWTWASGSLKQVPYIQICARAYSFGTAPFSVTIDNWSASQ